MDVAIAVPIAESAFVEMTLDGGVPLASSTLPGGERMACLICHSAYETLSEPYAAMGRWLAEHGYQPQLPGRERYLDHSQDGLPVTEIQFPIA